MTDRDTMRWARRGAALAALLLGWGFIAWQNHFHVTPPMVFVGLAYFAAVATIYTLWRTGAAAVAEDDPTDDSTWAKPAGALGELEREKRTLLKAIKEAEFDFQMGKLSKSDADEMIRVYRARAIEVIKDIDRLGHGAAGTTREKIMREVRARLELEAKSQKAVTEAKAAKAGAGKSAKGKGKPARDAAAKVVAAEAPLSAEAITAAAAAAGVEAAEEVEAEGAQDATAASAARARGAPDARSALASIDDDAMDADSTTAVESLEPPRDSAAKEATR